MNPSVPNDIDHVIHDVLDAHPLYARDCPDGLDKFNCSHVVEIIKLIIERLIPTA
jgi:hypothetical protein